MKERLLELARGGLAALEDGRQQLDDLNVFPVPDGDTGTNMVLTMRAVVEALERGDDPAEAALRGGQGNSGVILAEAIRGALGAQTVAGALRGASDAAYRAVRQPREGTMLTVLRELAEEAEAGGDAAALVRRGDECVTRTTDELDVLRDAGVVDAGAAGIVEIVRGIARASGADVPPTPERRVHAVHRTPSRYRYCTAFLVDGEDLDADALERELAALGDSLLVVGDAAILKAHVHTDEPERALDIGRALGSVSGIAVADMHEQMKEREQRLRTACAAVAIAAGTGNRRLFESLGATAVAAPGDVDGALEAADADEVIVLANGADVTAGNVLATRTIQEGLSAMVEFDPARTAAENLAAMRDAAAAVASGAVLQRNGRWVGLLGGDEVAEDARFDEVARTVVERLLAEPRGVLTFLTGDEPQPLEPLLAALAASHPELELEVHDGGQPDVALLLAAE